MTRDLPTLVSSTTTLSSNRDDQLIYIAGSFDDAFDDLGVPQGLITHRNEYAEVQDQVAAAG